MSLSDVARSACFVGLCVIILGASGCGRAQNLSTRDVSNTSAIPGATQGEIGRGSPLVRNQALAKCFAITKHEGQDLQVVERYNSYAAVGLDDIYLEECLRLGGTWQAVAQRTPKPRAQDPKAVLSG